MTRYEPDTQPERPVLGFLGYGSLLAPEELDDLLDEGATRVIPVCVEGFRRLFNQEASWRESEESHQAVLNAVRNEDHEMNAVFMPDLSRSEYRDLRVRESGYRMVEVLPDEINPYESVDEGLITSHDIILISTGTKVNDDIQPIPEYIDICIEGAKAWGDQFYRDFVETTEIQPGEPLDDHLETRQRKDTNKS